MTGKRLRILLIEDNDDHALLIRKSLRESGFDDEVIRLETAEECRRFLDGCIARTGGPGGRLPDLVLVDLQLPGADGHELLAWINQTPVGKLIPKVILSTSADQSEVNESFRLGAGGHVVKTPDFEELKYRVGALRAYWGSVVELPNLELARQKR